MVERTPLRPEAELRHDDRKERERQYSYDLTKQLTFFVISAELVFCGYILLNAKAIGGLGLSSILFILAGLAAMFGVFWRFFYNEVFHAHAHSFRLRVIYHKAVKVTYFGFVVLSLIFLVLLLIMGYGYLSAIEEAANSQANGLSR